MERVAKLISRTPPEGLTEWAPVRDSLEFWGLVYEAVWVPDNGLEQLLDEWARPRKRKMVEVRCSCCGESRLMPWAKTDGCHGGYGFLQEDERSGETALIGSGDESICPICGEPVRVRKAAEIGQGYFLADETQAMSAAVVGMDRYLALTGWTIQRRVSRNASAELKVIPAEAYVFDRNVCQKLMGWRNSYRGNAGYFITYLLDWSGPKKWHESWGRADGIFGLTPELIAESCLPNCKLDVYMEMFHSEKPKYPVMYLRLYQHCPNVENLLLGGLPMVLDDLLDEARGRGDWERTNSKGLPHIGEIHWKEARPAQMLGLTKEELRLGREQCWSAFFWRLFVRTKAQGERLTGEDIQRAFMLGDQHILELPGQGPVAKSLRYLLKQVTDSPYLNDPYVDEEEFDEPFEPVPSAYADATTLLDYWHACRALGRNLDDPQVRFPRDLIDAHDRALEQSRKREAEAKTKSLAGRFRIRRRQLAKYIFEADGLKIVPAGSQRELQAEADALHHCVWTYGQRHAKGETAIFFIRRTVEPGQPYYTLELDEKTLTVRQNRGLRNCGKTAAVQAFEDLWISWVRAGAKRNERGRPILPERKKEAKSA